MKRLARHEIFKQEKPEKRNDKEYEDKDKKNEKETDKDKSKEKTPRTSGEKATRPPSRESETSRKRSSRSSRSSRDEETASSTHPEVVDVEIEAQPTFENVPKRKGTKESQVSFVRKPPPLVKTVVPAPKFDSEGYDIPLAKKRKW